MKRTLRFLLKIKTKFFLLLFLPFVTLLGQAQPKYTDLVNKSIYAASTVRLPNTILPVQACWFWTEDEFAPSGYKELIDQVAVHSPYNLLSAIVRLQGRETTSDAVHNQIKLAADYANEIGISLLADLDVRTARRAFQSKYPDELQEMLLLRDVQFQGNKDVEIVIRSKDISDHYTGNTIHYIPLYGTLLRVYGYEVAGEDIIPGSLCEITSNCVIQESTKDSIRIKIPGEGTRGLPRATVMVSFTHLAPDVFAPHLMIFQREIIRRYKDVALAGVFKDEWGFPPCFDGSPMKDQFWYSKHMALAYAERTGGRDFLSDCLMMHKPFEDREPERQMAINHFMEMLWQRNGALEDDYYHAVKEVFGLNAAVTTHPTWWPYPDLREQMKNGLDWWVATRDWAQTDEYTPFAVRTALSKKWGSPIWYNMFYSTNRGDYCREVWSSVLAGGRINYHPLYPSKVKGIDKHLNLLRGDLMLAESRVRMLNYISNSPLNSPVAVIFGHACTMNWAGPSYDDVGMELVSRLWCKGIAADLIPSSEIENHSLRIDQDGSIRYGDQRYEVVILYHPEFEKNSASDFFHQVDTTRTALFRIGDWTRDFNGQTVDQNSSLPLSMVVAGQTDSLVADIKDILTRKKIFFHTPSITLTGKKFAHAFVCPPTTGFCRLIDGTLIQVAGTVQGEGDPIRSEMKIQGVKVVFDAEGLTAIRLNQNGEIEAMAAGGLKSVRAGKLNIDLDERMDVVLWKSKSGEWEGVIQGCKGPVPKQLLTITRQWSRLELPEPLPEKQSYECVSIQ